MENQRRELFLKVVTAAAIWFVAIVTTFAIAGRVAVWGALLIVLSLSYFAFPQVLNTKEKRLRVLTPENEPLRKPSGKWLILKMTIAAAGIVGGMVILGVSLKSPEPNSLIGIGIEVARRLEHPGARRSIGNGYQILGYFRRGGQLDWSHTASCDSFQISWKGVCWPVEEPVLSAIELEVKGRTDLSDVVRADILDLIEAIIRNTSGDDRFWNKRLAVEKLAWAINPVPTESAETAGMP